MSEQPFNQPEFIVPNNTIEIGGEKIVTPTSWPELVEPVNLDEAHKYRRVETSDDEIALLPEVGVGTREDGSRVYILQTSEISPAGEAGLLLQDMPERKEPEPVIVETPTGAEGFRKKLGSVLRSWVFRPKEQAFGQDPDSAKGPTKTPLTEINPDKGTVTHRGYVINDIEDRK